MGKPLTSFKQWQMWRARSLPWGTWGKFRVRGPQDLAHARVWGEPTSFDGRIRLNWGVSGHARRVLSSARHTWRGPRTQNRFLVFFLARQANPRCIPSKSQRDIAPQRWHPQRPASARFSGSMNQRDTTK